MGRKLRRAGEERADPHARLAWPWMLPALLIVLPPLAWLAVAVFRATVLRGAWLPDRLALGLLGNSVMVAGTATLLAAFFGVSYGWLTARYR
ncbi:MAG TPA: hypothetical protein VFU47_00870, partial [Armatimonadota bacterium]|nr:hypothetical protein [Armatimonadota bacterium]